MEERHTDIEKRVEAIERLLRDAKITLAIVGACLVAFLGYQSFLGIPKAIDAGFKEKVIVDLKKQAELDGDAIINLREQAKKVVDSCEDYKGKAREAVKAAKAAILEIKGTNENYELNRVIDGKLVLKGKVFEPAYFATCTNKKGDSVGSFYPYGNCPPNYDYTSQKKVLALKCTNCN